MQLATRVDEMDGATFKEIARQLGTTPSDALRMFVAAFNAHKGFPFDVRLEQTPSLEFFSSEDKASDFTTNALKEAANETW